MDWPPLDLDSANSRVDASCHLGPLCDLVVAVALVLTPDSDSDYASELAMESPKDSVIVYGGDAVPDNTLKEDPLDSTDRMGSDHGVRRALVIVTKTPAMGASRMTV